MSGPDRIFRYEIPVDDQWHQPRDMTGDPLFVAARRLDVVELWAVHSASVTPHGRRYRVFGTGHPLPAERMRYIGTAMTGGGTLVWHVFEQWGVRRDDP